MSKAILKVRQSAVDTRIQIFVGITAPLTNARLFEMTAYVCFHHSHGRGCIVSSNPAVEIMTGYVQSTNLEPVLRFHGFDKAWELSPLGKFVTDMRGGASLTPSDFIKDGNFKVIPKKAIKSGGKLDFTDEFPRCSSPFWQDNPRNRINNDYLVTTLRDLVPTGPTIGFIVEFDHSDEFMLAQGVYGFRIERDHLAPRFLTAFSNRAGYRRTMRRLMVGSTQVHVRNSDFLGVLIAHPTLPEQQKIAAFLGAVDDKIDALRRKHDGLKQFKAGLMQKLFSQELRFKRDDGTDFPEWEEKRLGNCGSTRTSSVDKLSRSNERPAQLLNYMDVYRRDTVSREDAFQDITAKDKQFSSSDLKRGDVLFTPSSETPTDIGHSAVVVDDLPGVLFSYHLMRFRPRAGLFTAAFLAYAFKRFGFFHQLWRLAQGATRFTISKDALEQTSVEIPVLEEQQKIADCLSAVDAKIEAVDGQITQMEAFKKGLLQKMFV